MVLVAVFTLQQVRYHKISGVVRRVGWWEGVSVAESGKTVMMTGVGRLSKLSSIAKKKAGMLYVSVALEPGTAEDGPRKL